MNGKLICTIVLVAIFLILTSFTNGSNLRETKADNVNAEFGGGGKSKQFPSFLSLLEQVSKKRKDKKSKDKKSKDKKSKDRECLGTRNPFTGTFTWDTPYWFAKEKNCEDGNDKDGADDNCLRQSVINFWKKEDVSFPKGQRLLEFIDITKISVSDDGKSSTYTYNCQKGKGRRELGSSKYSSDGYIYNGQPNTLCRLLNKRDVCKNFEKLTLYANGCSENNCQKLGDNPKQDRNLNRRIKLEIEVEERDNENKKRMVYRVSHEEINSRRRRLLQNGFRRC
eukprot:g7631.t1